MTQIRFTKLANYAQRERERELAGNLLAENILGKNFQTVAQLGPESAG